MDDMVSIMPVFTPLPAFAYFNFRTGFSLKESFVGDKNTILFAIENILNKAYTEPMSFQRIQPGRSFKLFLTTEF